MKSNPFAMPLKMLAIIGLSVVFGYQPSESRAAGEDPCDVCDMQFWACGGWQNDFCVSQYARCLLKNGCPPIESVRGGPIPGMNAFVPVAGR